MASDKSRTLKEVINKIIMELPLNYSSALGKLKNILQDSVYMPPECEIDLWRRLQSIASENFPDPGPEGPGWAQKIGKIIRNEE